MLPISEKATTDFFEYPQKLHSWQFGVDTVMLGIIEIPCTE